jgi:SAM-dependent methyltransferase
MSAIAPSPQPLPTGADPRDPVNPERSAVVADEISVLESRVPLSGVRLIELGCGAALLVRRLLDRHQDLTATCLEVDARQHAKNLADPRDRLSFVEAPAQAIPFAPASFDLALMLKSLHHVPRDRMADALAEIARVVRPGGWLYVSEPVYAGPFNEIVRLFNDEREVRAAAQAALDTAVDGPHWAPCDELRFELPLHFEDFAQFERRIMRPTFADHRIDEATEQRVRAAFSPHLNADGARFLQPLHVRLLRRR